MFGAPGSPRCRTVTGAPLGALFVLRPPPAHGETSWLATRGRITPLRADPGEPRSAVSWSPADLHLAPAVCGRFSLVDVGAPDGGWGGPWRAE